MADLVNTDTFGLPVNRAVCFSTHKDTFHEGTKKRQVKILKPLVPLLKQLLEPDEQILRAIRACSPMTILQQLTAGAYIYYIKRCVLILTNKRILHFPTRGNYSPRKSVSEVRYGDIAKAKVRGFLGGVLTLEYRSGRREKFYRLPSREVKKLKGLLAMLPGDRQVSPAKERVHVCPKCLSLLQKRRYSCSSCRLEFKDETQAARMALLVPGGGYFYAKLPALGILYGMGEAALLVLIVILLVAIAAGRGDAEEWAALIGLVFLLGVEKLLAVNHARHFIQEYLPVDEDFVPIKSYAR